MARVLLLALPHIRGGEEKKEGLAAALRPFLDGAGSLTILVAPGRCETLAGKLVPRLGFDSTNSSVEVIPGFVEEADADERWLAFRSAVVRFALSDSGAGAFLVTTKTARLGAAALVAGGPPVDWAKVGEIFDAQPALSYVLDVTASVGTDGWPELRPVVSVLQEMTWKLP